MLKKVICQWAAGILFTRDSIGIFDLCDDLRFPQNHTVQAAYDFEEMRNGIATVMEQDAVGETVGRNVVKFGNECRETFRKQ